VGVIENRSPSGNLLPGKVDVKLFDPSGYFRHMPDSRLVRTHHQRTTFVDAPFATAVLTPASLSPAQSPIGAKPGTVLAPPPRRIDGHEIHAHGILGRSL
jgi:hypothetical protein